MVYTTEIYLLTVLEAGSPRLRCQLIWFLVRALFLVCRWPPSYCVLTWCKERKGLSWVFFFWPHGMWDPNPPTRDWTCAPCIGSTESQPLDLQGSPLGSLLVRKLILLDQIPTLMTSFNLNYFHKDPSPNTEILELEASTYKFWRDTNIQSIILPKRNENI